MKDKQQEFEAGPLSTPTGVEQAGNPGHWRNFALMSAALVLCFGIPFYELVRLSAGSELYSYIFLIPPISIYLAWLKWKSLPPFSGPARKPAAIFFAGGLALLGGYALARCLALKLTGDDYLAFTMTAFVSFFASGCCWFLGKEISRALIFPIGFLIFLVPLPTFLLDGTETFLQYGSAWAASIFFSLAGATFFRDNLVFQLPGINIQVAPECSGIHSSVVLLITSAIAGHLFLKSPRKRLVLMLAVIPLALLRNGFRVFVIGELCTHIGPQMIDSPIHRKGGPLFFALSLIPFFLLLIFLHRSERPKKFPKHN